MRVESMKSIASEASLSGAAKNTTAKQAKVPSEKEAKASSEEAKVSSEKEVSSSGRQVQVAFGVIGALPPSLRSRPSLRRSRSSGSSIGTAGEIASSSLTDLTRSPVAYVA